MEIKDSSGQYVMADDSRFEPIYKDIASHGKTLMAHQPNPMWPGDRRIRPIPPPPTTGKIHSGTWRVGPGSLPSRRFSKRVIMCWLTIPNYVWWESIWG